MTSEIVYPFGEQVPAGTELMDVAPGVKWLRMPLPMALDHINLYLIDCDDGWLIVDTGMNLDIIKSQWEQILDDGLLGKPLKAVLVTHMHPDHVGLAGWLCEKFRIPLFMSEGEYFQGRCFSAPQQAGLAWSTEQFYLRAGHAQDYIRHMAETSGAFASVVYPMPVSFQALTDGQILQLGKHRWQVVIGRGHSPEHVCLYCDALGVLIAGDQVIAKISSNVSVTAVQPEANPLAGWLDSHQRFLQLPESSFVLPAHNRPFQGLHHRLHELIAHHEDHMLALEEACVEPKSAVQLLPVLFKRALDFTTMGMAVGECIAHLNLLIQRKRISRSLEQGVYLYRSIDPTLGKRLARNEHVFVDDEPIMV